MPIREEPDRRVRRRLGQVELLGLRGQGRLRRVLRRRQHDEADRPGQRAAAGPCGRTTTTEDTLRHADGAHAAAVLDRRLHRLDGGPVLRGLRHDAVPLPHHVGASPSTAPTRSAGCSTSDGDVDKGVQYMQTLGVRYYLAFSPAIVAKADANPNLTPIAQSGPWQVYEVARTATGEPAHDRSRSWSTGVDGNDRDPWLEVGHVAGSRTRTRGPAVPAADGPGGLAADRGSTRTGGARPTTAPGHGRAVGSRSSPRAAAGRSRSPTSRRATTRISFDVDKVGVPVLVKASYFPNWKVERGQGPVPGGARTSWSSSRPSNDGHAALRPHAASSTSAVLPDRCSASSGWSCCGARAGRRTARPARAAPAAGRAARARRRPLAGRRRRRRSRSRSSSTGTRRAGASPPGTRPAGATASPWAPPMPTATPACRRHGREAPSPPPAGSVRGARMTPLDADLQGLRHPRHRPRPARRGHVPRHRRGLRPLRRRRPRILVGHDMRPSGHRAGRPRSPTACARRASTSSTSASCSTDLVYFAAGPLRRAGRHVHRLAQPGAVQRHQAVPGRGPAGRRRHRPGRDPGHRRGRCSPAPARRPAAARGSEERRRPPRRLRRPRRVVRRPRRCCKPLKVVADTANGMGGLIVPKVFERLPVRPRGHVRRARRHVPEPPGRPDPAGQPARPPGAGRGRSAPTSGWPSTATPTGSSSSTRPAGACPARPPRPSSPPASWPGSRAPRSCTTCICSRAVPEVIREHGGVPVRTRVGHSYIKQVMAETGAVFGGEHSAHYYFRDNYRADSGIIATMVLLGAALARPACRCRCCASRSSATRPRARSTPRSPTRRP